MTSVPENKGTDGSGQGSGNMLKTLRSYIILFGIVLIVLILFLTFPDRQEATMDSGWSYLMEMMTILPAVMVLMGLFTVWVPDGLIDRYLGSASGWRGRFISIGIGVLPTGPLYIAFPVAHSLQKKGASSGNIIIFLSAWACIKLPQELVELEFLGWRFMVLRLFLTIVFVIIMGIVIEKIMNRRSGALMKTS